MSEESPREFDASGLDLARSAQGNFRWIEVENPDLRHQILWQIARAQLHQALEDWKSEETERRAKAQESAEFYKQLEETHQFVARMVAEVPGSDSFFDKLERIKKEIESRGKQKEADP